MKIKNYVLLYMVLAFCYMSGLYSSQAAQLSATKSAPMFSVLSWNILGPNTQDVATGLYFTKGDYSRLDVIVQEIQNLKSPYILCLQEIDQRSEQIVSSKLTQYQKVGYQGKGGNGGVILFVRKDKFNIKASKSIKLEGDNGQDGAAVVALLESKATGSYFIISSLHLNRSNSASGWSAGKQQLEKLLREIQAVESQIPSGITVHKIFAGDFNTLYKACVGSVFGKGDVIGLIEKFYPTETYKSVFGDVGTVQKNNSSDDTIDYILYSGDLQVMPYSKVVGNDGSDVIQKQVPSDHALLYGVFIDPVSSNSVAPAAKTHQVPKANTVTGGSHGAHLVDPSHTVHPAHTGHSGHTVHVDPNQQKLAEKKKEEEKEKMHQQNQSLFEKIKSVFEALEESVKATVVGNSNLPAVSTPKAVPVAQVSNDVQVARALDLAREVLQNSLQQE